jgi:hypothetical protein
LLCKYFKSGHELQTWFKAREKQLKDPCILRSNVSNRRRLRRRRGYQRRPNNREGVRHPELGNITRSNRKR